MPRLDETFMVKFGNGSSVQNLKEAMELVDEALLNAPWSDDLKRAAECLKNVWDGLSFSVLDE
jgi:hypothetical protein